MSEQTFTCRCCGQEMEVIGWQHFLPKMNRPSYRLVHCMNTSCAMYKQTSSEYEEDIIAMWKKHGSPVKDGAA